MSPEPAETERTQSGRARVVDRRARWQWRPVGSRLKSYQKTSTADADYMLNGAGRRAFRPSVVDRRTGEVVATVRPTRPGFQLNDMFLVSPWLVWSEVEEPGADLQTVIGHVYDLRTGKDRVINAAPRAHDPGLPPTWWARGRRLVYTTQDGQRTNCIAVLDLRRLRSRVVYCTKLKRQGAGFPRLSGAGLGFNEWHPSPGRNGCFEVLAIKGRRLAAGRARPVPARQACKPFSGAVGPDFVAWDESFRGYPDSASLYAKPSGEPVVGLDVRGVVPTAGRASHMVCRRWLYWKHLGPGERLELRRWRPGRAVQIIYRNPNGSRQGPMTAPSCQPDRITFKRAHFAPDYDQLFEALTPSKS